MPFDFDPYLDRGVRPAVADRRRTSAAQLGRESFQADQFAQAAQAVGRHALQGTLGSDWGQRCMTTLRWAWTAYSR